MEKRRSPHPEVPVGLSDVLTPLGVLANQSFTLDFSLSGGHSDLLDYLAFPKYRNDPAEKKVHILELNSDLDWCFSFRFWVVTNVASSAYTSK